MPERALVYDPGPRQDPTLIEAWRCEYNEERPKKGLGGLTPALYAKQLAAESSTVTPGL